MFQPNNFTSYICIYCIILFIVNVTGWPKPPVRGILGMVWENGQFPFHLISLWTSWFLFLSLVVGETAAGKASRSLAQHIPGPGGMEGMKGAASGVVGDLARARIALDERGQKLGELEERTAAMMASAESFSKHAHHVRHFFGAPKTLFSGSLLIPDSHFSSPLPSDDAEVQR